MSHDLRIGLLGLDTSHVKAFASLLNDQEEPYHIPGARIVAGYPGGSPDFALSSSRVGEYTHLLSEQFGVTIYDDPLEVADRVDIVFITSVDGRVHKPLFEMIAYAGKPTFIDKPLATSLEDAQAIAEMAYTANIPVMSCSSLRYSDIYTKAMADDSSGGLVGIDVCGPMQLEITQPGMFWYGIHAIDLIVSAMGPGCRRVSVAVNSDTDLATFEWSDGRMATYRGMRSGHKSFGIHLHHENVQRFLDPYSSAKPIYAGMLEGILRSLPNGYSDVPGEQMLEVIRVIEATNHSRNSGICVDTNPPDYCDPTTT